MAVIQKLQEKNLNRIKNHPKLKKILLASAMIIDYCQKTLLSILLVDIQMINMLFYERSNL